MHRILNPEKSAEYPREKCPISTVKTLLKICGSAARIKSSKWICDRDSGLNGEKDESCLVCRYDSE